MVNLYDKKKFIELTAPFANQIKQDYGIEQSISTAQSCLESNWGLSELTKQAQNWFGMTAGSWEQKYPNKLINMPTHEDVKINRDKFNKNTDVILKEIDNQFIIVKRAMPRLFRLYDTDINSWINWADLISKFKPYAVSYKYAQIGSITNYANEVSKVYATDIKYAQLLIGRYNDIQSVMKG